MLEIGGKKYFINITRTLDFLNAWEKKERRTNEIVDVYDYETKKSGVQTSKSTRELREEGTYDTNSMNFNIVYAMVLKILECPAVKEEDISIGARFAINSMIKEKLLEVYE